MDKNIAALLREDTRTVRVSFCQIAEDFDTTDVDEGPLATGMRKGYTTQRSKPANAKLYTYVTDLPLAIGDTVVVEARGEIALAFVRSVDDDVKIEPNCDIAFNWVVAKVDLTGHAQNMARNAEIERTVAEAYRNNMRRSFAAQILAGVDDNHREGLAKLLGKSA